VSLALLLADGPEANKAGPLGLLTILVLGVACYFLWRSMNRHLKKVPESFDEPAAGKPGSAATGSTAAKAAEPTTPAEPPTT
jgi:hypothetical protein